MDESVESPPDRFKVRRAEAVLGFHNPPMIGANRKLEIATGFIEHE